MIRIVYSVSLGCMLMITNAFGQFDSQLPKPDTYVPAEITDSIFGITMYEKLNMRLAWDSIRNCRGYACTGWVKDYYTNGRLLHKGYYQDGQLKVYNNYYPDGASERAFRIIDDTKSEMILYYPDGKIKSKIRYIDSEPQKWEDFYPSGSLAYIEEHHKNLGYYIIKSSYARDGSPRSELLLDSKKDKTFDKKEYHDNGKIKVRGRLTYNRDILDYQKIDTWEYYDESGKNIRSELYENGAIINEINH